MDKKGSILMISLWILAMLAVFAVSMGHRASINLKLAGYQRDKLKACCLAKAGIQKAILELSKDKNEYDSLGESWSTGVDSENNQLFQNVEINKGSGEAFTVKYNYDKNTYLCMADEERKVNINRINSELRQQILAALFESEQIQKPQELKDLIIKWIDSVANPEDDPDKVFKNSELSFPEELLLILEFFYKDEDKPLQKAEETYDKIKDFITVYGNSKININTVSRQVLKNILDTALIKIQAQNPNEPYGPTDAEELFNLILSFRDSNGYFRNVNDINSALGIQATDPKSKIIDFLIEQGIISVNSNNIRIEATGSVKNKVKKRIVTIVERLAPTKLVYWHEN